MLVSQSEGIKMLEDESFCEFYTKITDLRNSMINLEKKVSDVKLIKKILRSLPERFRIKVTSIEESKDLDEMKVEELVGSLLTYELTLPPVKKNKSIALKAAKGKNKISSDEKTDDEDGNLKVLNKLILTKRILEVLEVLNVQVLGPSKQIVETSSRQKVRLSMPLLVMIRRMK